MENEYFQISWTSSISGKSTQYFFAYKHLFEVCRWMLFNFKKHTLKHQMFRGMYTVPFQH